MATKKDAAKAEKPSKKDAAKAAATATKEKKTAQLR